eukprot:TCONS_00054653-protein
MVQDNIINLIKTTLHPIPIVFGEKYNKTDSSSGLNNNRLLVPTSGITNVSSNNYPEIPLGTEIGISTAVFAGLGILINALVITVIVMAKTRQYSTYKHLMLHLAACDFLCSIMLLPYVPLELKSHYWTYPDATCQIIYPTISLLTNVSTGTILIITIERFRGVWFPHARQWGGTDVKKAFAIVWLISLVSVLPNIIMLRVKQYDNIIYCNEVWDENDPTYKRLYGFSFLAVSFFIPLLGITIMHTLIICRLKYKELTPDNMSAHQQRQNQRIMRVLTGIIAVFFCTVSPNKILYFVWDVDPQLEKDLESNTRYYLRTVQFFYWSRVAINPMIYCFFDTRFKKDFKKSTRRMRGLSIRDSEVRSRSASQRTSTILSVRSRANSSFIGEAEEAISRCNRMSKISEMDATSLQTFVEDRGRRVRSATVDTDLSVSPMAHSTLVKQGSR